MEVRFSCSKKYIVFRKCAKDFQTLWFGIWSTSWFQTFCQRLKKLIKTCQTKPNIWKRIGASALENYDCNIKMCINIIVIIVMQRSRSIQQTLVVGWSLGSGMESKASLVKTTTCGFPLQVSFLGATACDCQPKYSCILAKHMHLAFCLFVRLLGAILQLLISTDIDFKPTFTFFCPVWPSFTKCFMHQVAD